MKEQKWDDFDSDSSKELLEVSVLTTDETEEETQPVVSSGKSRVTELRRRIEERLESKRIALEYDYLMLDEIDLSEDIPESSENLQ